MILHRSQYQVFQCSYFLQKVLRLNRKNVDNLPDLVYAYFYKNLDLCDGKFLSLKVYQHGSCIGSIFKPNTFKKLWYLQNLTAQSYPLNDITSQTIYKYIDKHQYIRHRKNTGKLVTELYLQKFICKDRHRKILYEMRSIQFCDCKLDERMFKKLSYCYWELYQLEFDNCGIGEKMGPYLSLMKQQLKHLRFLTIESELISSRGYKKLIKVDIPNMQRYRILNTNMTADTIKIFHKTYTNRPKGLGILNHDNLNTCYAFKLMTLLPYYSKTALIICIFPCHSIGQFVYVPQIIKVESKYPHILYLHNKIIKQKDPIQSKKMIITPKFRQLLVNYHYSINGYTDATYE